MLPVSMSSSYRRVSGGGVLDFEMDTPQFSSVVYIGHALLSLFHLLPTWLCVISLFYLSATCGGPLAPNDGPCFGAQEVLLLVVTLIPFSMFCGMMFITIAGACGGGVLSQQREKWVHLVSICNLGASTIVGALAGLTAAGWVAVYIVDGCHQPGKYCGGPFTVIIVSAVGTLLCMACQAVLSLHVVRKTRETASDMQYLLGNTV